MTLCWFVGVSEHRRDELAENELIARGFDVCFPRHWSRKRTHDGHMRMGYDLTHAPYFYARFEFDCKLNDEYALALRQRGVAHFLEKKPTVPGAVPSTLIEDHRVRELAERANIQVPRGKGRGDLVLKAKYTIRSGSAAGLVGTLTEFGRGRAYLDVGSMIVDVPDNDIDVARDQKKSA